MEDILIILVWIDVENFDDAAIVDAISRHEELDEAMSHLGISEQELRNCIEDAMEISEKERYGYFFLILHVQK